MSGYTNRIVKEMQNKAIRFFSESSLNDQSIMRCAKILHQMRLNYDNRYRQYFTGEDIPDVH